MNIRLESFEGPLDLLLFLIQSREMDITTVSITEVTDQYLATLRLMQELDFDIASEFLVIAATLLYWKSRALLPQETADLSGAAEDEPPLTAEDLLRRLLEHQKFKQAGAELTQLPRLGEDVFARENPQPPIERRWKSMNMTDLVRGYQDMLTRSRRRKHVLKKETVSIAEKILEFSRRLKLGELSELKSLMAPFAERPEVVVTFLASLELSRLKKLKLYQEGIYAPIFLELIDQWSDFNLSLATGFDAEPQASEVPLT